MRIDTGKASMWRYADALPLPLGGAPVTLGEGWTPLIEAPKTAQVLGCRRLFIKDESQNPTGTFKDRSASYTVSRLREEGARGLVVSSTGNAGSAFAMYAARAAMKSIVLVPDDAIEANLIQARAAGADVHVIPDWTRAAAVAEELAVQNGFSNVSAGHTPYRSIAKETLAFEIAEQLDWHLPDVVVCPTGGGIALLALQSGFERVLGRLPAKGTAPRLMASQHAGCAPIARAHAQGHTHTQPWTVIDTPRGGMRTPNPAHGAAVLRAVKGAGAHAVTPESAASAAANIACLDGIFVGLEAGTALAAIADAIDKGTVAAQATVLVVNTATALKSDPAWLPCGAYRLVRLETEEVEHGMSCMKSRVLGAIAAT